MIQSSKVGRHRPVPPAPARPGAVSALRPQDRALIGGAR